MPVYSLPGGGYGSYEDLLARAQQINAGGGTQTGTTPTGSTPSGFVLNPQPQAGGGTFGQVPGVVGLPEPAKDVGGVYQNLPQTNKAVSDTILSQIRGELSPDTINRIRDVAAEWGASAGVPGSGVATNRGLRDIGLASEAVQQQGIGNYNATLPVISRTQTVSPELQSEIAIQNSINAAAPTPSAAQSYSESLFNRYLRQSAETPQTSTVTNPLQQGTFTNLYGSWQPVGSFGY